MKKYFLLFTILAGALTFSQTGYAAQSGTGGCNVIACNTYSNQQTCEAINSGEGGVVYCRWVAGTCQNIPCGVTNCCYCISDGECGKCADGYTLTDDGQCQEGMSTEMCQKTPESPQTPVLEGDACHVAHCTKCCDADDDCMECEAGWHLNDDMTACVVGEEEQQVPLETSKITALIVESDPCD